MYPSRILAPTPLPRKMGFQVGGQIAKDQDVEETGYRLLTNHGEHAHQEVPHFHSPVRGRALDR